VFNWGLVLFLPDKESKAHPQCVLSKWCLLRSRRQADRWLRHVVCSSSRGRHTAALLLSLHPDLSLDELVQILTGTAEDVATPGWDESTVMAWLTLVKPLPKLR